MEFLRRRIESQVLSLSGIALGQIDFEKPQGDPGLFGPDSVSWQVHGDFTSMLCGGVSALLLQMLHPLALAGVWDHSNFRDDIFGRLLLSIVPGSWLGDAEWARIGNFADHGSNLGSGELLSAFDPARVYSIFGTTSMWIGIVAGTAMIAAAIWIRRRRIESSV